MAGAPQQQPIPPDVEERSDAVEVLRAFVVDGGLSIAFTRAFEDPAMWGMLLADIARHAAGAFEKEGAMSADEALARITEMLQSELGRPTGPATTAEFPKQGH
jgi:hypothetical protein